MITTCPRCGKMYEESSTENADDPGRLCLTCYPLADRQAEIDRRRRAIQFDAANAYDRVRDDITAGRSPRRALPC